MTTAQVLEGGVAGGVPPDKGGPVAEDWRRPLGCEGDRMVQWLLETAAQIRPAHHWMPRRIVVRKFGLT